MNGSKPFKGYVIQASVSLCNHEKGPRDTRRAEGF